MKNKNTWILLVFVLLACLCFPLAAAGQGEEEDLLAEQQENIVDNTVRAKVTRIISEQEEQLAENYPVITQQIEVKITDKKYNGQVLVTENIIDERMAYNLIVEENDEVFLYLEKDEQGQITGGYIYEIIRDKYLLYLTLAFALTLIIIGGSKGLRTVLTLALTVAAIIKVLLPLILKGYDPVLVSVCISTAIIAITLLAVSGLNRKTISAILGTTGGVIIAGILALLVSGAAKLTGLGSEEAQMLLFIPQAIQFDFKGLLFAGIIMGAMGAIMDVGISIASAMSEIELAQPSISGRDLIKAGLRMGRDIIGTMSNTLILAYVGGSLHLLLLFLAYRLPLLDIINRDAVAAEIVRALAGSIGLCLAIPLTALAAGTIGRTSKTSPSAGKKQTINYN